MGERTEKVPRKKKFDKPKNGNREGKKDSKVDTLEFEKFKINDFDRLKRKVYNKVKYMKDHIGNDRDRLRTSVNKILTEVKISVEDRGLFDKFKNVRWQLHLKKIFFIIVVLGILVSTNPILADAFIKAVVLTTNNFTQMGSLLLFLKKFKLIFMGMNGLHRMIAAVSAFVIISDDLPAAMRAFNSYSDKSLMYIIRKALTETDSVIKRINNLSGQAEKENKSFEEKVVA